MGQDLTQGGQERAGVERGGQVPLVHLPVEPDGFEVEAALVAERAVEAAALDAQRVDQVLDRRRPPVSPPGPEQFECALQRSVLVELAGGRPVRATSEILRLLDCVFKKS